MVSDPSSPFGEAHKAVWVFSRQVQGLTEEISFDDFKRLDMRTGVITNVEPVKRTEKLYKILVDLGSVGTRQTVSSLVGYYAPNELVGKRVVFLSNLKQAKFAGEVSQGMLLAAEIDGKLALLTTDRDIESGARIT
jgi:methionine--tRNA ligase beta chain